MSIDKFNEIIENFAQMLHKMFRTYEFQDIWEAINNIPDERWGEFCKDVYEEVISLMKQEQKKKDREYLWETRFECPKCGIIPVKDVTTMKTCIRCGSSLIRGKPYKIQELEEKIKTLESELEDTREWIDGMIDLNDAMEKDRKRIIEKIDNMMELHEMTMEDGETLQNVVFINYDKWKKFRDKELKKGKKKKEWEDLSKDAQQDFMIKNNFVDEITAKEAWKK